jgi:hypothetical protein
VDTGERLLDLYEAERRSGLINEDDDSWSATRVSFSPDGGLVAFANAKGKRAQSP